MADNVQGKGDVDLKLTAKDLMSPVLAQAGESIKKLVQQSETLNKVTNKIGSSPGYQAFHRRLEGASKAYRSVTDSPQGKFSKWMDNAASYQADRLRASDEAIKNLAGNANAILASTGIFATLKVFAGFEDAIADLRANLPGLSKIEFDMLTKKIMELGDALPYTSSEVAAVTKALARSGMGFDQIMSSMEPMLKLDVAAGTKDPGNVALTLQLALETFSKTADEAELLADKMLTVSRLTGTTPLDFQKSLAGVGAQLKEQGIGDDETLAILGTLTKQFRDPFVAKTGFKAIIRDLLELKKKAKDLGQFDKISAIYDKNGKIPSVLKALDFLTEKNADFFTVFQDEARESALALKQNMDNVKSIMNDSLGMGAFGQSRARGEVARQYNERAETLTKKLDELKGALEKLAIRTADEGGLADIAKEKIESLDQFLEEINRMDSDKLRSIVDSMIDLGKLMATIAVASAVKKTAQAGWGMLQGTGAFLGPWGTLAAFVSVAEGDETPAARTVRQASQRWYDVKNTPELFSNYMGSTTGSNQSRVVVEFKNAPENMTVAVPDSDPFLEVMRKGYNFR